MEYITGIHALNLTCELDTYGDWHTSALKWEDITILDSSKSIFGDWGIEKNRSIPESDEKHYVANHIRALLDLIDMGKFSVAQGMREQFIGNEVYTELVFDMVWQLRGNKNWEQIDKFMRMEYKLDWVNYPTDKSGGSQRHDFW